MWGLGEGWHFESLTLSDMMPSARKDEDIERALTSSS